MFPLNEVIENGSWLRVEAASSFDGYLFQFRPTGFSKIDLSKVDSPEEIGDIDLDSNIWLLNLDIINLGKKEILALYVSWLIKILDEDSCVFSQVQDSHLSYYSDYAKSTGLPKFWNMARLPPKIRKSGAFTYELPDFFEQLFFDAQRDCEICNISLV